MIKKSPGENQNFQEWARDLFYTKEDVDKIFVTSRELWTATIVIVVVIAGGLWSLSGRLTRLECALGIDCPDLKRIEKQVGKTLLPNEKMTTGYFNGWSLAEKILTAKEQAGDTVDFMFTKKPLLKVHFSEKRTPVNLLMFYTRRKEKQISPNELEKVERGTPLVAVYETTAKGTKEVKSVHFVPFR